MLHWEDVEAGSAVLRVDWPVYPRRAEHNTVAEGGNRRWAETARQNAASALNTADCGARRGGAGAVGRTASAGLARPAWFRAKRGGEAAIGDCVRTTRLRTLDGRVPPNNPSSHLS